MEERRVLDRFLVDNAELEELSARLSTFNIFAVLGIEKTEIRHSNILAWLLDPGGSHGLRDAFLRRLLSSVLHANDQLDVGLSAAQIELAPALNPVVLREYRHADLVVVEHNQKWVLLIENKIKARESTGQLRRYATVIREEFAGFQVIPVFLTIQGDDPSEEALKAGYIPWSHEQIHDLLMQVIRQRLDRIPEDARVLLDHYLSTLRRLIMADPEIVELCKKIYHKHRKAIDLINELGASTRIGELVQAFLEERPGALRIMTSRVHSTWFFPEAWEEHLQDWGQGWPHLGIPFPVACWVSHRASQEKVGILIEVGPMDSAEERQRLVKAFDDAGFKVGKRAYRDEAQFTRVFTCYRKVQDFDEEEAVQDALGGLWSKAGPAIERAGVVVKKARTTLG